MPSSIEKPLAFQKREPSVTRTSSGAVMKRSISTSPAGVRLIASTWPTWMRLKSTGAPIAIEPPSGARSWTRRPGVPAGVCGARGRPSKSSWRGPVFSSQLAPM